jgi:hypothetical protein
MTLPRRRAIIDTDRSPLKHELRGPIEESDGVHPSVDDEACLTLPPTRKKGHGRWLAYEWLTADRPTSRVRATPNSSEVTYRELDPRVCPDCANSAAATAGLGPWLLEQLGARSVERRPERRR